MGAADHDVVGSIEFPIFTPSTCQNRVLPTRILKRGRTEMAVNLFLIALIMESPPKLEHVTWKCEAGQSSGYTATQTEVTEGKTTKIYKYGVRVCIKTTTINPKSSTSYTQFKITKILQQLNYKPEHFPQCPKNTNPNMFFSEDPVLLDYEKDNTTTHNSFKTGSLSWCLPKPKPEPRAPA